MAVVATKVFQLKVTLRGSRPPIWRRLLVPEDYTLGHLHAVLQESFGWDGSHLHHFVIGKRLFGEPDPDGYGEPVADEYRTILRDVVRPKSKLLYEYDFGDSWRHEIVVEKVLPAAKGKGYPTCTDGKRAGPPEDSGGVWGYEEKLSILADPEHEEHEELLDWMPEGFSPAAFDREALNRSLAELGAAREDSSASDPITDLHAFDHDLVERMLHFARGVSDFDLAADLPVRAINSPEELGTLIAPWAAYEYALGDEGDTLCARFLKANRRTLSSEEVAWLEAQGRAWFAPWEVVGVVPGASVDVRDLLTGEERHVTERGASQDLRLHDVVLARIVDHEEIAVFCGMHPRPLGPRDGAAFAETARKVLRRMGVARLTPDMLRAPDVGTTLIRGWEVICDALDETVAPPEVSAMVLAMKTKHYTEWCDIPVPALGNLTPRAVAASGGKRGHAELELMMKEIARIESAGPPDQAFDVNILRHELGLLAPNRARPSQQRQPH